MGDWAAQPGCGIRFEWGATGTARLAAEAACLAVARSTVSAQYPWSLSPTQLRRSPFTARAGAPVVAACPRNVTAVGSRLAQHGYGGSERPVAVIAAGERWPDGTLRPALEDLLAAGALIADLGSQGAGPLSAEAACARACAEATADIPRAIAASASGRESASAGFAEDVVIATEEDACTVVPVMDVEGAFAAAT
ncbi:2-phosphosulfolactate phosphatase [Streptomyces sp. NPDC050095]|uniref:2-phosphosulfolactate phosphatase n=1 Tax=unclassified Streptomyces TaxID=2593676 RepID=UPI003428E526